MVARHVTLTAAITIMRKSRDTRACNARPYDDFGFVRVDLIAAVLIYGNVMVIAALTIMRKSRDTRACNARPYDVI